MVKRIALLAAICGFPVLTCHAHHGFAVHYDVADQVRIEGTIHAVKYRNPHSEISVVVSAENGDTTIWSCETQASSILARKGITKDRFPLGEPIVIVGAKARRHPTRCEIGTTHLPDGGIVTMRSEQGRANIAVNPEESGAAEVRESIFGLWVRDSFTGAPVRRGFLETITEAGKQANSQYDGSRDDPTRDCRPVNPVRAMFAPGSPTEIRQEQDRVVMRHEFMDTTRVIYLDASQPAGKPDEMGFSIGRFEDGILIVETDNFTPGVLLTHVENSGVLHSDQMTLSEAFEVDRDTGQLIYRWEAKDPLYFTGTIGGQLRISPTLLPLDQFDCQPQSDD
jgi:hypothetical protein